MGHRLLHQFFDTLRSKAGSKAEVRLKAINRLDITTAEHVEYLRLHQLLEAVELDFNDMSTFKYYVKYMALYFESANEYLDGQSNFWEYECH